MRDLIEQTIARPLVGLWLRTSSHSWHRSVIANDSPHVHAPGTNPDRILVTGDGAATGRGVVTHDLGLPGYLARNLTAHTGRASDVDIVVTTSMTAATCLTALEGVDLDRFDIVLLSLGANEALALASTDSWAHDLGRLLSQLEQETPEATRFFVLPIPFFGNNPFLPSWLARVVDRHVQRLNAQTQSILESRPRVTAVPVAQNHAFEPDGSHVYERWAQEIALRISTTLDPSRPDTRRTERLDEQARQRALAGLDVLGRDPDPLLDRLTARARQAFGTSIAAVTLIQSDTQFMRSASGIEPIDLPRDQAFCDITIRRAAHFVIEDATLDPRYADYSVVTSDTVRFYAGYPIEARDGQRVGALCVMDSKPRQFSEQDATLLRILAHEVQEHLWRSSDAAPGKPSAG